MIKVNARVMRLQEEIKKEVSFILQRKVKDPRLGLVSITDVELSGDYSHCKVFVSILGNEEEQEQTMLGLQQATGFVRSELAKEIRIRKVPQLVFVYDSSLEHGSKINAILKELDINGGADDE